MAEARFRGMILFGTDEPVPPPIILRAGPLTAELEDGNLRYIRLHGHEMIRAVSYLVRDRNWGTYRPEIRDLSVESNEAQFIVRYLGQVADAEQSLTYRARIEGRPDGSLSFAVDAESPVDFVTNRAGFVVLHPVDGVAGEPVMVEDADGRRYGARFPDLIDPMQPFKNLRALTHEFARDHKVTCRMEGDVFEMEDQRNWLDASFKTYVRPLERPWPYVLEKGRPFSQAVHLSVDVASGARLDPPQTDATIAMARAMALPGGATQLVPVLGFGLEARHTEATRTVRRLLQEAQPHHVVCLHYPGASRDEDSAIAASLGDQLQAAHDIAPQVWLEAVVTSVDDYANELSSLARTVSHVGKPVATLLVSPEADLKSTTPGGTWPPAPPLAYLYAKAREAFPGVRIGGGMFSYFTELNRKRPPTEELDLVTFTTCSIVHACDDRSVTEGLEVLPSMLRSARAFIGSTPLHVGPSAIGMRMNPYGTAPTENPNGIRRAMARNDPRQKGLLGAAWALAYVAHMAREGVEAVTLGGGVGDFGLLRGRSADSTAAHGEDELILNPVFHVFRGLARLAGAPLLGLTMSPQRSLQAIGACVGETSEIWVANLTGDELAVHLWEDISGRIAILDEGTFEAAESDPRYMDQGTPFRGHIVSLRPYAVARLEMDPGNR
jgi:hypothetical protein